MVLQDRAKVTRASVIDGAARVFETMGYGNASLTDIADSAGVTKGALYFHFKSKEELAKAVIEEQHSRVRSGGQRILENKYSALTTMVLMCREFGRQLRTEPIVRAGIRLTLEASAFGQSVKGPYQDWIATMEQLTVTGQREGDIRSSIDPPAFARYVVASFTGVQMVSEVLTNREDVMERIDDMWTILLPGILCQDRKPVSLSDLLLSKPA